MLRDPPKTENRYSVTGNAQDAEDVLQTIFLRILRPTDDIHPKTLLSIFKQAGLE